MRALRSITNSVFPDTSTTPLQIAASFFLSMWNTHKQACKAQGNPAQPRNDMTAERTHQYYFTAFLCSSKQSQLTQGPRVTRPQLGQVKSDHIIRSIRSGRQGHNTEIIGRLITDTRNRKSKTKKSTPYVTRNETFRTVAPPPPLLLPPPCVLVMADCGFDVTRS